MMAEKPSFFIAGAPKCGTTALYQYLKQNPSIFMPEVKEPHYFANDIRERRSFYCRSEPAYKALFENAKSNQICGEASVWYLYSDCAFFNIRKFNPEAKIIIVLRNPVQMVASLFTEMKYGGTESRSRFEDAWRDGNLPKHRPAMSVSTWVEVGSYSKWISRLREYFPSEQVKIFLFDDLIASPQLVYESALAFLEIPSDGRKNFAKVNQAKESSLIFKRIIYNPPRWLFALYNFVNKKSHYTLHRGVKRAIDIVSKPAINNYLSPSLHAEVSAEFQDDIIGLESLINRNLSAWKA